PTRPPLALLLSALALGAVLASTAMVALAEAVRASATNDLDEEPEPEPTPELEPAPKLEFEPDPSSERKSESKFEPRSEPKPAPAELAVRMPAWNNNPNLAVASAEKSVWRATMLHEGAAELSGHLRELLD